MGSHFEDRIYGLLLGALDERTGVDHDHVGVFDARREFGPSSGQQAHHHFAVDEVLRTSQADEAHLLWGGRRSGLVQNGARKFCVFIRDSEVPRRHGI